MHITVLSNLITPQKGAQNPTGAMAAADATLRSDVASDFTNIFRQDAEAALVVPIAVNDASEDAEIVPDAATQMRASEGQTQPNDPTFDDVIDPDTLAPIAKTPGDTTRNAGPVDHVTRAQGPVDPANTAALTSKNVQSIQETVASAFMNSSAAQGSRLNQDRNMETDLNNGRGLAQVGQHTPQETGARQSIQASDDLPGPPIPPQPVPSQTSNAAAVETETPVLAARPERPISGGTDTQAARDLHPAPPAPGGTTQGPGAQAEPSSQIQTKAANTDLQPAQTQSPLPKPGDDALSRVPASTSVERNLPAQPSDQTQRIDPSAAAQSTVAAAMAEPKPTSQPQATRTQHDAAPSDTRHSTADAQTNQSATGISAAPQTTTAAQTGQPLRPKGARIDAAIPADSSQRTLAAGQPNLQTNVAAPMADPDIRNAGPAIWESVSKHTTQTPPLPSQSPATTPTQLAPLDASVSSTRQATDGLEEFTWDLRTHSAPSATPTQTIQARPELPPHLAQQLAQAMHRQPDRPLEIALNPAELGRIRMTLTASEGGITVNILADRPDTIDLMRRNIDDLGQSFADLGYEDIAFAFGQNGDPSDASDDPETGTEALKVTLQDTDDGETPHPDTPRLAIAAEGVDLRL